MVMGKVGGRGGWKTWWPNKTADFVELSKMRGGVLVTFGWMNPPLHEFLPHTEAEIAELAAHIGKTVEFVKARADALHEQNPMLGHRGCRLAITYPEICEMQTRAILSAALECKNAGIRVFPEIEVPLVGSKKEVDIVKSVIDATAQSLFAETGDSVEYTVGSMIELPRAAVLADQIAESCEFFEFGTNDLTQTTLGMSRDDTGKILDEYRARGIYVADPFASVDQAGVGILIEDAVAKARKTKGDKIHLGVCVEHCGDPASVEYFHRTGFDSVSCSPFRVPIARLAAAQAAVKFPRK